MNQMDQREIVLAEQSLRDMCALVAELTGGTHTAIGSAAELYRAGYAGPCFYSRLALNAVTAAEAAELTGRFGMPLVSYAREILEQAEAGAVTRLGALLHEMGYALLATQTGMLLRLDPETAGAPQPGVVRVARAEIGAWSDAVCRAFHKPDELPSFQAMAECDDCFFYACREGGAIVGTTLLYTRDGNAGIHEVGVLPEYRRSGIAEKLVRHALYQAGRSGARLATLQASAMGEPLYRKLGFQACGTLDTWVRAEAPQG